MNRRSFLTGLFAAPAIIAVERLMPVRLFRETIWGDGIHDDWAGVQAWIDGLPVDIRVPGFSQEPGAFYLGEGIFRADKTLKFPVGNWIIGAGYDKTIIRAAHDISIEGSRLAAVCEA